jgi:hypothetical protein
MTLTRAPMTDELVSDGLVEIDGESYYGVSAVDRMPPFLMSVVSDGDRWMFVSSTGALTAGRADASCALFPYVTDDRLHATAGRVGPVTALRVSAGDGDLLWIPFQERSRTAMHRRLFKSVAGNVVVFEEANPDLRLSFRYRWAGSERFGFVRTATLVNQGDDPVRRRAGRRSGQPPPLRTRPFPLPGHEQPDQRLQAQRARRHGRPPRRLLAGITHRRSTRARRGAEGHGGLVGRPRPRLRDRLSRGHRRLRGRPGRPARLPGDGHARRLPAVGRRRPRSRRRDDLAHRGRRRPGSGRRRPSAEAAPDRRRPRDGDHRLHPRGHRIAHRDHGAGRCPPTHR